MGTSTRKISWVLQYAIVRKKRNWQTSISGDLMICQNKHRFSFSRLTLTTAYHACASVTSHVTKWWYKWVPHSTCWVNFSVSLDVTTFQWWSTFLFIAYDNFFFDSWNRTRKSLQTIVYNRGNIVRMPDLAPYFNNLERTTMLHDHAVKVAYRQSSGRNCVGKAMLYAYLDKRGSIN